MTRQQKCLQLFDTDLYALTGEKFSRGETNTVVVSQLLDAGVRIIQYREKEKKMGAKYAECQQICALCRDAGAAFIVNDDVHLAMLLAADGVHVGQQDLPVSAVRELVGEEMLIGLSTHCPEQADLAVEQGADYIGVGPVFATQTKDDVCAPVGLSYVDYVAGKLDVPFVAIGGIKAANVAEVVRHGARCVAMITELVGAQDKATKIREIQTAMAAARSA